MTTPIATIVENAAQHKVFVQYIELVNHNETGVELVTQAGELFYVSHEYGFGYTVERIDNNDIVLCDNADTPDQVFALINRFSH